MASENDAGYCGLSREFGISRVVCGHPGIGDLIVFEFFGHNVTRVIVGLFEQA